MSAQLEGWGAGSEDARQLIVHASLTHLRTGVDNAYWRFFGAQGCDVEEVIAEELLEGAVWRLVDGLTRAIAEACIDFVGMPSAPFIDAVAGFAWATSQPSILFGPTTDCSAGEKFSSHRVTAKPVRDTGGSEATDP